MKVFKAEEFVRFKVPEPNQVYRAPTLTEEDDAKDLFGIFGVSPPGRDGRDHYHYHEKRESIFVVISGEATVIVEGKETQVKAGDMFFIPAKVAHTLANKSGKEFRILEFCTCPPVKSDFHPVPWK